MRLSAKRKLTKLNVTRVPAGSGVYVLFGSHGSVVYVGRAVDLRMRLAEHLANGTVPAVAFAYARIAREADAKKAERDLVVKHAPRYNVFAA